MKKITSIILAILLLAALLATSVFATGEGASASVTSATGAPGELVYVTVSLSGMADANTIGLRITPDTGLSLDKENSKWLLEDAMLKSIEKNSAAFSVSSAIDVNTDVLSLAFVVPTPEVGQEDCDYNVTYTVLVKNGSTTLYSDSITGTITVKNPATSLELDKTSLELDLNGAASADLAATYAPANTTEKLTWSSSNNEVATVANGEVTAVAAGEATITAKIGSLSRECAVTVTCSHDLKTTNATESTCKVQGNNTYYSCSTCGKVFSDADGKNETTVDKQKLPLIDCKGGTATCTKRAVCSMCGQEYGVLADHVYETKLSHDADNHWYACSNDECLSRSEVTAHTFAAEAEDYTWAADYSACTVVGACVCDETYEAAAMITSETTDATCGADGETVYTATFDESWAETQTATKVLPATGDHDYEATGYTWTAAFDACTVTGKCAVCSDTTTVEADVSSKTTENNCGVDGEIVYTAVFDVTWADTKTETKVLPATGDHDYVPGDYIWGENNGTCAVVGTCSVCEKTVTANATVTEEVTKQPTCIDKGVTTYTATFTEEWADDQKTTSDIAATGKHTADGIWQKNETHHWQGCTTANCTAELEKAEHAFRWVVDEEATEDKTGLKHEECDCGFKRSEGTEIDKLPHKHIGIESHAAVEATCVAEGNVEYWTCSSPKCAGKYYGDGACQILLDTIVVPVNPENHGESELRSAVEPTCYQSGYTGDMHCVDCEAVVERGTVIDPTGEHIANGTWQNDASSHWQGCKTSGCNAQVNKGAHDHKAEYTWDGYAACAAVGTCECGHVDDDTAEITSQTTAATCGADGKTVYTATFTKSWAVTQTAEEILPATGKHTYKIREYFWTKNDTGYDCVAEGICGVCSGTIEKAAVVTAAKTDETCGDDGQIVYTAVFEGLSWATKQEKTVVLPATGNHTYAAAGEYTWAADLSTCSVSGACGVCGDTTTATAQATSAVTTEPTCIHEGVKTYTADFAETWAETQTTTAPVAATGVHVGGEEWITDEGNHWHVCSTQGCNEIVDKAEHSFAWVEDKAATEDETGLKHEECECGDIRSADTVIDKLPHKHIDIKHHDAVAATCVAEGNVEYWTCGSHKCTGIYYADAQCSKTYEDIVLPIDPANHGETELRDYVAPSCYKPGYSGDTYCLDCGKVAVYGGALNPTGEHVAATTWKFDADYHWNSCTTDGCQEILNKTAHTFVWVVDKAATEDETGLKHEQCDCGFKRNEETEIPKLDHVHVDITHHAAVKATCVAEGKAEYWTCGSKKCEDKYYGDEACQILLETIILPIDPANHGELEVKDAVEATCSEAGYTGDTYCTVCEALVTEGSDVPATGKHKPAKKYLSDETQHWQECSHCGIVVESTQSKHTFKWIVDKQPTEAATGLKHEECTVCDYTRNEKTVVDKLKHAPYKVEAKDATCTENGRVEHFYCSACGNYYASNDGKIGDQIKYSDTVVPATGHSFGQEWLNDEQNHWQACQCGETNEPAQHEFQLVGEVAATQEAEGYTGDEVCSVCGYVGATGESIAAVEKEVTDESGEIAPAPEAETTPVETAPVETAECSFPWWIILIVAIVVVGGIVLVVFKKRRAR